MFPQPLIHLLTSIKRRLPFVGRLLQLMTARFKHRDTVIAHGVGRGLRFNCAGANLTMALGTYEPELQELLQRHAPSGGTAYDIGANVGFVTVLLARLVGPTGTVIAFEPQAEQARYARRNAALNAMTQVRVRECAVGNENGTVAFALDDDPLQSRVAGSGSPSARQVCVPMIRLDDERDLPPPQLIKLDIEGADVAALRGMRQLLRAHHPVLLCEAHGTGREVIALLSELGYRCECHGELEAGPPYPLVVAVPAAGSKSHREVRR